MTPSPKLWGLLTRRERWGLSWRGRLAVGLFLLGVGWAVILGVYPFLAVTHRVETKALVVEGWVEDYVILAGKEEFRTGHYDRIFTTGGPLDTSARDSSVDNTAAMFGATRLVQDGIASGCVQSVPCRPADRDRTFSSAIALREWFRDHGVSVNGINIVTEGVHARRTRLLFQKAFGGGVTVGIIAARDPKFDPKHWWRSSEGVREVLSETIAYLYARLIFVARE